MAELSELVKIKQLAQAQAAATPASSPGLYAHRATAAGLGPNLIAKARRVSSQGVVTLILISRQGRMRTHGLS